MPPVLALILAIGLLFPPVVRTESASVGGWTKGDQDIGQSWLENLRELSSRLDDCAARGLFSNSDRVPDVCHGAYTGAEEMIGANPPDGLVNFLWRSCARWRNRGATGQHRDTCEQVGAAYWRIQDALDRATFTGTDKAERDRLLALNDATTKYVASVNASEVTEKTKYLREMNATLQPAMPNVGMAFLAGQETVRLRSWVLTHCPSQLAWGVPSKAYATALTACSAFEPEMLRFEDSELRLLQALQTAGK